MIKYKLHYGNNKFQWENWSCANDPATSGMNHIFNLAKNENYKIYLSGHGADEIFSDYGCYGVGFIKNSEIKGKFPDDLKDIFPWFNFYDGCMKMFISKEEGVATLHGIETRYPFLDKNVVQEFLNLSPLIKNRFYKAPLYFILKENNFPFEKDKKLGFSI